MVCEGCHDFIHIYAHFFKKLLTLSFFATGSSSAAAATTGRAFSCCFFLNSSAACKGDNQSEHGIVLPVLYVK
jgi:hypothetical protein